MKILQIIPSNPGWHITHYRDPYSSGARVQVEEPDGVRLSVICWALVEDPEDPVNNPAVVLPVTEHGEPVIPEDGEYGCLLSPDQSYEYKIGGEQPPTDEDWTAQAVSEWSEGTAVLWRKVRR